MSTQDVFRLDAYTTGHSVSSQPAGKARRDGWRDGSSFMLGHDAWHDMKTYIITPVDELKPMKSRDISWTTTGCCCCCWVIELLSLLRVRRMKAASSYAITMSNNMYFFFFLSYQGYRITICYLLFFYFFRFWNVFKAKQFISICQESITSILILTIFFFRVTLHHQPVCNWLVCKIINTKKGFHFVFVFTHHNLFVPLEFYSLFLSSQSILIVFWYLDDFPIGGWSPREETGWGTVNTDGWSHLPELSPGSVSPLSEPWSTVHQ